MKKTKLKTQAIDGKATQKSGSKQLNLKTLKKNNLSAKHSDSKLENGKMDKKNFYVRLTDPNKKFVINEANKLGLSYTAYMNYLLSKVRQPENKKALR